MLRLEVSGAVRPIYGSLGVKRLSQINPRHAFTFKFFKILVNIILPSAPKSSYFFLSFRLPQPKPISTPLLPQTCHTLRPSRPSFDRSNLSSGTNPEAPQCIFLHPPLISPVLVPNISISTLTSETLSQCPPLSVTVQVTHPHKTDMTRETM